jgi:Cu-Zn family superoxide dismutase
MLLAGCTLLVPSVAIAQESSPVATPDEYEEMGSVNVILTDVNGNDIGAALFKPLSTGGIQIIVQVDDTELAAGEHGIHVHQTGVCDPAGSEPFSSAGEHFNPSASTHGSPLLATPGAMAEMEDAHAGDLGNIMIDDNGSGRLETQNNLFTLEPNQPNSLLDADGSAIIIHQDTDDLHTDPSGNSGPRAVCGVVFEPGQVSEETTENAASGEATPAVEAGTVTPMP